MFVEDFAPIQSPVDELYGTGGTGYENWSVGVGFADDPVLQAFLGLEAGQTTFEFLYDPYDPYDPFGGYGGHVPGDGFLPLPGETGDGDDDNVIIVKGNLNTIYVSDLLDLGMTLGDLFPTDPLAQPDGGEGDSAGEPTPESEEEQDEHACKAAAVAAAREAIDHETDNDGIRNSSDRQPEYGLTIARDGDSFVVGRVTRGESYSESDQPKTELAPPRGFDWENVVAMIHSHPEADNSAANRRNRAPSDADWLAADEAVARGANPDELTIYIIDKWGDLRAFDYMTPEERGATRSNPSGNQDSASDGQLIDEDESGCAGDA